MSYNVNERVCDATLKEIRLEKIFESMPKNKSADIRTSWVTIWWLFLLIVSVGGLIYSVRHSFSVRELANELTAELLAATEPVVRLGRNLSANLMGDDLPIEPIVPIVMEQLPLIMSALIVVSALGLLWSILARSRKYKKTCRRVQLFEDMMITWGDELRQWVASIRAVTVELEQVTSDTETLVAELLTNDNRQAQKLRRVTEELVNMTETIDRVEPLTIDATQPSRELTEVAQQGVRAAQNTVTGLDTASHQIQETVRKLRRLGEDTQQINGLVKTMQDVTERINIASLNALVQAAVAGETGREFADIAGEVQRVADRSGSVSNKIKGMIEKVQQDTNSAIAFMESSSAEMLSSVATANQVGKVLNEIDAMSQEQVNANQVGGYNELKVSVVNKIATLQPSIRQSELKASQIALTLEQTKAITQKLKQAVGGFKPVVS